MSKPPVNQDVRTKRVFHQFSQLNDELVTNILSYIADIPYQISSFGKNHGFLSPINVPIGAIMKLTNSFIVSKITHPL